jgi:hypothetical protein
MRHDVPLWSRWTGWAGDAARSTMENACSLVRSIVGSLSIACLCRAIGYRIAMLNESVDGAATCGRTGGRREESVMHAARRAWVWGLVRGRQEGQ